MVGGETKIESAFSWADEVEKEEEEARFRTHERQRPNPFGSARPREVVLQEKGIDWRKLDQDLHQPSNTRYETPVEKPLKENNPAYSAWAANKKQEISSGRSLQSKSEIRDPGFNRREVSGGFMTPQKQMGGVFVGPPPRYQTRNVLACLSEEAYHNSYRLDSEERTFQYRNHIDFLYNNSNEAGREMMFHEPQTKQFYNSGGLGIEGHIHHYDDQFGAHTSLVGWDREYREFDFGGRRYSGVELRRPWMEALHCGRNLGKSVACEERRDADADYNRRKFMKHSSGCWPLANERKEALLIHEKRPPSVDDHARNGGVGRRLMNPPSNGAAQQRRETLLIHEKRPPYVDDHATNGGVGRRLMNPPSNGAAQQRQQQQQRQHNNSGSRMVKLTRREMYLEKKENETEWQRDAGRFGGGSMEEAGDGERAEGQCNMKKKGANSAGNYRKRMMKSGPESYHQHGKRR
ncbi:hypothetical protein AAG906_035033 [Vitis piasezkii]